MICIQCSSKVCLYLDRNMLYAYDMSVLHVSFSCRCFPQPPSLSRNGRMRAQGVRASSTVGISRKSPYEGTRGPTTSQIPNDSNI